MFKIIKKGEYILLKRMSERQDNYIKEIKLLNKEKEKLNKEIAKRDEQVNSLNDLSLKKGLEILSKNTEILNIKKAKRIVDGRVGGLQASLNRKIKEIEELEQQLLNKNNELKEKEIQLNFYKNHRRAPTLEEYKNYVSRRKELEKRSRNV